MSSTKTEPAAASPAASAIPPERNTSPGHLTPAQVEASLWASIKDGLAWSVMVGVAERYVGPFLVLGESGLLKLAAISGLPGVAGALVQCSAARMLDNATRRRPHVVWAVLFQALTWLPFCYAVFLPVATGYWVMLAAFVLYVAFANFCAPAWTSWIGDLVPPERRGRYFGLRGALTGGGLVLCNLAAGAWITWARERPEYGWLGLSGQNSAFLTLFAVACGARLMSVWYLTRMHEPPYRRAPSDHFTLMDFIRRAPRAHFGRFVFYCMGMNAGIGSFAPFLAWYILGELHHSPLIFAWIGTANLGACYLATYIWGRLLDRLGSKRILAIGGIGLAAMPALLLLSNHIGWLAVVQVYDGIVSAAFGLAAFSYIFDVVTPPKRARCAAYYSLFVSAGMALGMFVGAFTLLWAPAPLTVAGWTLSHPFQLLLIVSTVLRLLPNLLLLGTFAEFRLSRPVFFEESAATP